MLALCMGITAFALYFIYDVNSFLWKKSVPRTFFTAGSLLIAASLVLDIRSALPSFSGFADILLLIMSVLSVTALIYTLFFALPFEETYARKEHERPVCDQGAYALCRHPGILCFFFAYLFAGLAALPSAELLSHGILFSLLNLLYAWFQDRITFPRTFTNYHEYQQKVPFLLPTQTSMKRFIKTLNHSASKEVEL